MVYLDFDSTRIAYLLCDADCRLPEVSYFFFGNIIKLKLIY